MADLGSQLNQLTPEQRQMVLARAQQEANQQVMQGREQSFSSQFMGRREPLLSWLLNCFLLIAYCRNDEAHGSRLL